MNTVKALIDDLMARGWTCSAIARELGVQYQTVYRWRAGKRAPSNSKSVIVVLEQLLQRKRIPKKRQMQKARHKARNLMAD